MTETEGDKEVWAVQVSGERMFQAAGTAHAKVLRQKNTWHAPETERKPEYLEQNEEEGEE